MRQDVPAEPGWAEGGRSLFAARPFARRTQVTGLDTASLPECDQFPRWCEMAANFGIVRRPAGAGGSFTAATVSYGAGALIYSRHRIENPSMFERNGSVLDRHGADAMAIQYRRRGVETENNFRSGRPFAAGTVRITDMAQPLYSSNLHYENLAVVIPKKLLQDRLPALGRLHGLVLAPGPMTGFLKDHLVSAIETLPQVSDAEAGAITDVTVEMLTASLMHVANPAAVEAEFMDAPVLRAVRHYIDANLHRSDLGPGMIAHAVGVSRAKLYRVCQPYGRPMELVLQRRLRRAMAMLRRGDASITLVAFEVGFENRETFSRAFRREFGLSPRDFTHSYRLENADGLA